MKLNTIYRNAKYTYTPRHPFKTINYAIKQENYP